MSLDMEVVRKCLSNDAWN